MQRTLQQNFYTNQHAIRFLSVEKHGAVPYDAFIYLGLRHADACPKSVRYFFAEVVLQVKSIIEKSENPPERVGLLETLQASRNLRISNK